MLRATYQRRSDLLAAAIPLLFTLTAYLRSLGNGFVFDDSLVPLDPGGGRWLVSLGMLHLRLHEFERAEDELLRGLQMMEHSPLRTERPTPQAYVALGQVALRLGDKETSRTAFAHARSTFEAGSAAAKPGAGGTD